ncbi:hypothetical protein CEP52_005370 [Fusarium oligoseptatum]|uniref:DUF4604 domain-containing protein n=1 Tax=Fusarium oligoseptatum TaxID=2604345 RepID=A0A428TYF7_9HYPO|nr:hypothetical protein CEP52_005370 [Fusarium oligoseptatum]
MPPKITSKNLSYDNSAPPFLAALRAQAAGATGPDPLLAAQRRSAKKRSSSEEAEDVPLVVDEDGNVVNLEVDKDGTVKESANYPPDSSSTEKEPTKEPESKAAIGGRKRKVGKVIGEAADKETEGKKEKKHGDADKEAVKNRKPKKKAKKIKLSFDEDEG